MLAIFLRFEANLYSNYNDDRNNSWESPHGYGLAQHHNSAVISRLWEFRNENLQDRETVLGFNLTSTKATSRSGQTISATDVQNGWESGLSTLEDFNSKMY